LTLPSSKEKEVKHILIVVSVALGLGALAAQGGSVPSDVLTVYNNQPGPVAGPTIESQIILYEDGSITYNGAGQIGGTPPTPGSGEDSNFLYYMSIDSPGMFDPAWLYPNHGIVLREGGVFSDLVAVFNTGSPSAPVYSLGFYSGEGGPNDSATGLCPPSDGKTYPSVCNFEEADFNGDITSMLSAQLIANGWTATFWSDVDTPEPATLILFGIGLAALGLRKRIRA
jgi:hypothetical protein